MMATKKKKYDTHFQEIWTTDDNFKSWLKRCTDDKTRAYCQVCKKSFSVASGGIDAVRQHAKSKKHNERMQPPPNNTTIRFEKQPEPDKDGCASKVQSTITSSVSKQVATNAEIMWVLARAKVNSEKDIKLKE